ncbi:olfactory receptor 6N1-like [Onychostoma macrolepis]|uniref:olfactory receptor 6N1-like n=1 Tax=Onychostoma macrolepis TaxID=369639 RepID=UPI00272AC429|nr:olfactory receptor 6N1-like [Onychostoma macrolepis]
MQPLKNESRVFVFTLSGLNETMENRYVLLSLTALYYPLIVLCNVTVIFTIISHKKLHEPMYVFICSLCVNGLYGTSGFYPKFMYDLLAHDHVISFAGCLVQIFVIYSSLLCDFSTLTVMAYDRYVAICRPLEYNSVMTSQRVLECIIFCWLSPFFCMSILITLTSRLTLCGSSIEKLYCENWSIVKLSCFSTTVNNVIGFVIIIIYFGHAVLVFCSYIHLIRKCRKSIEGRNKFIQTCVPHLLALINVTTAFLFDVMFTRYGSRDVSQSLRNFMALEFILIPPMLNPLIYGLNLTTVRQQVVRLIFKKKMGISK